MPTRIYSKHLSQGNLQSGVQTLYTVPPGITTVVRDVEWYNGGTSATFFILVAEVPGFANVLFGGINDVVAGGLGQWEGRVVLPEGSKIVVGGGDLSSSFLISGYELLDA